MKFQYSFPVPKNLSAVDSARGFRHLYTECPLCESRNIEFFAKGDCSRHKLFKSGIPPTINWMRCAQCEHVFTDGYYTDDALKLIFSQTHENQQVGADYENQRFVSSRMIEKVLPFVNTGAWLDVGFGNASLLLTAQEYGFSPVGLDLRESNVNKLKMAGVEGFCKDIVSLDGGDVYSVISMADVLEHMPYPVDGLLAANRLLKKKGVLLLSMPNMDSVIWRVLSENNANPYWGELEHYHNFGRGRLYALLRNNGFEPVRYGISERYRACMEVVAVKA